jgi:hypothetical protein
MSPAEQHARSRWASGGSSAAGAWRAGQCHKARRRACWLLHLRCVTQSPLDELQAVWVALLAAAAQRGAVPLRALRPPTNWRQPGRQRCRRFGAPQRFPHTEPAQSDPTMLPWISGGSTWPLSCTCGQGCPPPALPPRYRLWPAHLPAQLAYGIL